MVYRSLCIECERARMRESYRRRYTPEWYASHKERLKTIRQRYVAKSLDRERERCRAYYHKNAEVISEKNAAYRAANPGKVSSIKAKSRLKRKEKAKAQGEEYRALRRVQLNARSREYRRDNPDKIAAISYRRRLARKAAGPNFTKAEWDNLLNKHQHCCVACGVHESAAIFRYPKAGMPAYGRLTADHIIPVTRGGSNAIENIQPMCLPCNNRKKNRLPEALAS